MCALFQPRPIRDDDVLREGPLSYEDYASMPDDSGRFELANGTLEAMSPAPTPTHQLWVSSLADVLKGVCQTNFIFLLAPVDVILGPKEVRQSDIVVVRQDRVNIITRRGVEGPPDLVVEVLSPHSAKRDRIDKLETYARYGIPEYWIVSADMFALERYILLPGGYGLAGIFTGEDEVESDAIPCARFSMNEVAKRVPHLPNA